ncbi:response regulator transcription factor [Luteolibacter yonseiensis]|uniref:Response regulator transcription factor n=1 Tax=Luteolibacter yonseiensis TaxID=1144680 RepID=A0A934R7F4_9BACT|nr:response regulator transcription factor [Luteolibacter yonseiensis]MBK1816610.1 response regulator transcription factor [Luteolibacter yonseiensis]
MRLLLIEDETSLRAALVPLLEDAGYRVRAEVDGVAGLERALSETFDLILLDVMLPGLDGFSICREIRRRGRGVPVLMLTARGTIEDRVRGLDDGADDYLVKPFSGAELLARVRALLRRVASDSRPPASIRLGDVVVDFHQLTCHRGGAELSLTAREFRMLEVMAAADGRPVGREEFLDKVWEYSAYPTTRTVDNQILALRQKLECDPAKPRHLITVHGIGYRLENGTARES